MAGLLSSLSDDIPWHRLPKILGLLSLIKIRDELCAHNLFDTENPALPTATEPIPGERRRYRTDNGTDNDLRVTGMGAVGTRFGRNFPLHRVQRDEGRLMEPNPRLISTRLLTRQRFIPAKSLNLLAAAWLQFQVHDWFAHKTGGS